MIPVAEIGGLTDFVSAVGDVTTIITGSTILSAMFAGSLLATAAYVFKKIKAAVKRQFRLKIKLFENIIEYSFYCTLFCL